MGKKGGGPMRVEKGQGDWLWEKGLRGKEERG